MAQSSHSNFFPSILGKAGNREARTCQLSPPMDFWGIVPIKQPSPPLVEGNKGKWEAQHRGMHHAGGVWQTFCTTLCLMAGNSLRLPLAQQDASNCWDAPPALQSQIFAADFPPEPEPSQGSYVELSGSSNSAWPHWWPSMGTKVWRPPRWGWWRRNQDLPPPWKKRLPSSAREIGPQES